MTDKIKVWKCEECSEPVPCISNERFDCKMNDDWQPTTNYEITERKHCKTSTEALRAINEINANLSPPPHRRVKIIWSEVTAENVEIAAVLKEWGKEEIMPNTTSIMTKTGEALVSNIPKTWLEDVVEGPVSAREWWDNNPNYSEYGTMYRGFQVGFHAGEQNQKKRHLPQQTFDEWVSKMYPDWTAKQKAYARIVWQACLKSHNLPTEPTS